MKIIKKALEKSCYLHGSLAREKIADVSKRLRKYRVNYGRKENKLMDTINESNSAIMLTKNTLSSQSETGMSQCRKDAIKYFFVRIFRVGGQERSNDEKRLLKHRPRLSLRKDTIVMRPTHPDAIAARNMIINGEFENKCRIGRLNNLINQQEHDDNDDFPSTIDEDLFLALPFTSIVEC